MIFALQITLWKIYLLSCLLCPLHRSSRFCHWGMSKEYFIIFTTFSMPFLSSFKHVHTQHYAFALSLCCKECQEIHCWMATYTLLMPRPINPNSFGSSVWMIPERKLSFLLHSVLNSLLFILTNISYPSKSLPHFIIWHDTWS